MSYIGRSLSHNEDLLIEGHFPWPYHALSWIALFTLGWFLIGIYIWARMQIHFATTEIGVTNSRVLVKRGLFNTYTMELGLASVEQVELRQSLIGKIFNFGWLELHGSGEGEICTPPIGKPVAFRRVLSDGIDRARNHQTIEIEPQSYMVTIPQEDLSRHRGTSTPVIPQGRGQGAPRGTTKPAA